MDFMHQYLENFRGDQFRSWMKNHDEIPIVSATLYLALVLYVQPHIMASRAALNLRLLNTLWNLLLAVFSMAGAYYCVPRLWENLTAARVSGLAPNASDGPNATVPVLPGNLYTASCVWNDNMFFNGPVGFWVVAFILSKIPEMIDTVFLVLQKKPVIFLHWYHHTTVMLFCWHAYVNTISSGLWFAAMNYAVHSIMYSYYFICSCGFRTLVRPFAPLITLLQILQMVVGTFIVVYTYMMKHFGKGCAPNDSNLRLGLLMYVSYFLLFSQLFYRSYISSSKKKDVRTSNGEKKVK